MNQTFCPGLFEVTDILDYDPVRKEVYFMSTENPNLKPNEDEDPKLRRDFKFSALILLAKAPSIKTAPGQSMKILIRNMFSMKIIESKVSANTRKLNRECKTCQEE